jgi:competence protein ComFC
MLPLIKGLGNVTLDFLFPKSCLGCGGAGSFLCPRCRELLPIIAPPICPKCGRTQASGVVCPSCITWKSAIDGIRAPYRFEGVVRQAIHQLKYRNLRSLAVPLACLMADYIRANPMPGEVLVPVPLHHRRLRERGYNQSELLAKELGKLTSLPVADDDLIRQKYALPQARTLSVEERLTNMAGAFLCRGHNIKGRRILLIDDVSTSAATLDSCALALKEGGATLVWGLVLAREI